MIIATAGAPVGAWNLLEDRKDPPEEVRVLHDALAEVSLPGNSCRRGGLSLFISPLRYIMLELWGFCNELSEGFCEPSRFRSYAPGIWLFAKGCAMFFTKNLSQQMTED
jgi:hypothetical protein